MKTEEGQRRHDECHSSEDSLGQFGAQGGDSTDDASPNDPPDSSPKQ